MSRHLRRRRVVAGDHQYIRVQFPQLRYQLVEVLEGVLAGTRAWFAEVRELILTWLPHAEDVLLAGADHSLALTHAPQIADALADFLGRHAITSGGCSD